MSKNGISPIEEIIKDAANGKMYILVDDENRENEGDLIIPAQFADHQAINFMAMHGRGLICLALSKQRISDLGLPPMAKNNSCRHQTAFTISIESAKGVTTGISAKDRALTIAVAVDEAKDKSDIVSPGHVFPLEAREGGVLVRAGHTEAAVDISQLAGLKPAGVICEIMKDDGSMARLPDLIEFAKIHDLKLGTIADLIEYRRRNDNLIERLQETKINSQFGGEFKLITYVNKVEYAEHIALVKGDVNANDEVPVRMHSLNILSDVLGDVSEQKNSIFQKSMEYISQNGSGVLVLLREPRKDVISQLVDKKIDNNSSVNNSYLRDYGIGAQILLDLGVKKMKLLSNSNRSIVGLEGYGIEVKEVITL